VSLPGSQTGGALAKAGFDAKSGYEALLKEVLPKLLVRLGEEKAFAQRRIATLQGEIERINAELVHISRKATRDKKAEEAVPKQAQIVKLQSAIAEIDGLIKAHTPEPEKKEDKGGMDIAAIANTVVAKKVAKRGTTKGSGKHKRKSTPHGAKKRRSKDDSDDEEEIEVEVKSSKSLGKKQRSLVKSGLESEEDKSEEDKSEEDEDEDEETKKLPLATQIVMNGEGKITEMLSAGRSASPFSGTMGAHTTAWIVHLDRVRRAILGKDTDEAWTTVGTELFEEAKTMRENLKDAFPGSSFHVGLMDEAKRNFEEVGKKYESLDTQTKALFLQDYVNHLLTYINYIPGATLESADTGGKGEGRKRRTLLDYETGEADPGEEKVSQAISGLLDTKVVGSAEKKRALVKNHREIIEKTYPRSHELAYPNKSVGNSAKKRGRSDSLEAINKNLKGVKQVKAEPPPINSFLPDFSVFGSVAPSSMMLNSPNFGHSFYSPLVTGSPFGSYQPLPPSTGGFEFKFSPEWEKLNK